MAGATDRTPLLRQSVQADTVSINSAYSIYLEPAPPGVFSAAAPAVSPLGMKTTP